VAHRSTLASAACEGLCSTGGRPQYRQHHPNRRCVRHVKGLFAGHRHDEIGLVNMRPGPLPEVQAVATGPKGSEPSLRARAASPEGRRRRLRDRAPPVAPSSGLLRAAGSGPVARRRTPLALATPRSRRAAPLQPVATAPQSPAGPLQISGGRAPRGTGSCRRSEAETRPFRATFQLGASEFQPREGAPGGVAGGAPAGGAPSFFTRRELPSFRKKASASAGRDR
jgi:hypothetical protein